MTVGSLYWSWFQYYIHLTFFCRQFLSQCNLFGGRLESVIIDYRYISQCKPWHIQLFLFCGTFLKLSFIKNFMNIQYSCMVNNKERENTLWNSWAKCELKLENQTSIVLISIFTNIKNERMSGVYTEWIQLVKNKFHLMLDHLSLIKHIRIAIS